MVSQIDMHSLHLRITHGTTPLEILGFPPPTRAGIRAAHRSLALLLHPDKCSLDQAPLHAELFKKMQAAYEAQLKRLDEYGSDTEAVEKEEAAEEGIPQTQAERMRAQEELRQRNWDTKQRLKEQRKAEEEAKLGKQKKGKKNGWGPPVRDQGFRTVFR